MANNIYTNQKVVTTSGTPVQLADQAVEQDQIVLVKAKAANTGVITFGNTSAAALNSGSSFYKLFPGQQIEIEVTNTKQVWIDASVSGEGVEYFVGVSGGQIGSSDSSGNSKTTLATKIAGEDFINDVIKVVQTVAYANFTADTLVKSGSGKYYGFIVNSHTSGTVKIWDNTSAATTVILNTITLAAGPQQFVLPVGINFLTGLFVDVGGTIDITILYA